MYGDTGKGSKRTPLTVPKLRQMKSAGEKIVALTAYDASFGAISASGTSTKARSCRCGCGTCIPGSSSCSSP